MSAVVWKGTREYTDAHLIQVIPRDGAAGLSHHWMPVHKPGVGVGAWAPTTGFECIVALVRVLDGRPSRWSPRREEGGAEGEGRGGASEETQQPAG